MKIITWNCFMSFRTKADLILTENPDIVVVPECENPQKLNFGLYTKQPRDIVWFGDNPHKDIGVFSYSDYKLKLLGIHNPEFRYVLPIEVSNQNQRFILFAVWAQKPIKNDQYVTQVWNAMHHYSAVLDNENVIIAGDFNSNSVFDRPNRVTHSALVEFLSQKKIASAYHRFYGLPHGKETHPTHFWQKKAHQPYHLDYCFCSESFFENLDAVEVGTYDKWIRHSDHKPLTVSFSNIDHCIKTP